MKLTLKQASPEDFDSLVELRLSAMRESLEAIGRFDRDRSIERFRSSFSPQNTKKIENEGVLVGFVAITENEDHLYLDHLYIHPQFQSLGIGSQMMQDLIKLSEKKRLPVRLGALKASNSNDFYQRHRFSVTKEDEWDIYYERIPKFLSSSHMRKVTLSGHIIVSSIELELIRKALPAHIEATRAEEGCTTFQVDEHPTEAGRFDVYEEFVSKAAFEHHQKRVKESQWGELSRNVARSYEIEGLEA